MALVRFRDVLKQMCASKYGSEDPEWVHFVRDHVDYIRNNSERKHYTTLELRPYKYRPVELYTSLGGKASATWIMLLINEIKSHDDFVATIEELYIPPHKVISSLRQQYESTPQFRASL